MNRIIVILAVLCTVSLYSCDNTEGYRIKGRIENGTAPGSKAYREYYVDGKPVLDSADVVAGRFEFPGEVPRPAREPLYPTHDGTGFAGRSIAARFTLHPHH